MEKGTLDSRSAQNKKIKILLVDDHPLMREALKAHLQKQPDFEVSGEAKDGEEAVRMVERLYPDIVIMDINMPRLNGIEATKIIKNRAPKTKILVLTVHTDQEKILGILEAGASGYLTKESLGNDVVTAVRSMVSGGTVISEALSQAIIKRAIGNSNRVNTTRNFRGITGREKTILKYAAQGMNNKEIALHMNLSLPTIKGYFVDIFAKLNVKSRTEAVMASVRSGLINIDENE